MEATLTPTYEELIAWLATQTWSKFATSLVAFDAKYQHLTDKQEAVARSMYAKNMAKTNKAEATVMAETKLAEAGIFVKNDEVYKVQLNQAGTNHYAKKLVEEQGGYRWEYVGGAPLLFLTTEDKLTHEKAHAFGKLYGVCINCGRTLNDEDSIYNGYGPICAANYGWPYKKAPLFNVVGMGAIVDEDVLTFDFA